MFHSRSQDWLRIAVGFRGRGAWNDSVPARDRRIHRRSIRKMKKKAFIVVGVAVVALLLAAVHLWGPGPAPPGQPPVVTLSQANFSEFTKAFDTRTDVPRLVFLLSPT
jgi:hypothetical protein